MAAVQPPSAICATTAASANNACGRSFVESCVVGLQPQMQQPQQSERRKSAEQVNRDDLRPQLQRDRPHTKRRLHRNQSHEQQRQFARVGLLRPRIASTASAEYQQPERASEVSMDHFRPRLVSLERSVRKPRRRRFDVGRHARHGQVAVTSRPIGTAETRVGKARVCTEHDDGECQRHRNADTAAQPRRG